MMDAASHSTNAVDTLGLSFADIGKSALDRFIEKCRNGLFGVLFIMSKKSTRSGLVTCARFLTDFLQVLAFTFSGEAKFPWNEEATSWLRISRYVRIDLISIYQDKFLNDVMWLVFASVIVMITMVNAFNVGIAFSRNQIKHLWPLRILRNFAGLIVTIGYIPLVSIFLGTIRCKDGRSASLGLECMSNIHIMVILMCSTLSVMLFLFSCTVTACFYEPKPARNDVLAKPHARADFLYLIFRTILTVIFRTARVEDRANHLNLAYLLLTFSATSALAFLFFSPYFQLKFVLIRIVLFSIWTWTNMALVLTVILDSPENGGISFMMFAGIPFVAALAYLCVRARRAQIVNTPVSQLRSAYEVELKARWYLEDHGLLFKDDRRHLKTSEEQATKIKKEYEEVRSFYQMGMTRFRSSSILRLFAAQFYSHFLQNEQLWTIALNGIESRSPSLDERFNVYRQRKQVSESLSSASADVLGYLEFEHTLSAAQTEIRASLEAMQRFWSELLQVVPDLSKLQEIGSQINRHVSIADAKCRHLLKLDRNSVVVLRIYASFLLHVINDQAQGRRMLERASQIETRQGGTSDDGGVLDNEVGVITATKLQGTIIDVNQTACKLLGRLKNELIRSSVNMLLPTVIARNHDLLMKSFNTSGAYAEILGRERGFFFQHKDGSIVMIKATIRSVPQMEGEPLVVVSVRSDKEGNQPGTYHALVEMPSTRIHACTRGLANLLGVPYHERLNSLFLNNYLPDLEDSEDALEKFTVGYGLDCRVHSVTGGAMMMECYARRLKTNTCWLVTLKQMASKNSAATEPKSIPRQDSASSVLRKNLRERRSASIFSTGSAENPPAPLVPSEVSSSAGKPAPMKRLARVKNLSAAVLSEVKESGTPGSTASKKPPAESSGKDDGDDDDDEDDEQGGPEHEHMLVQQMRASIIRDESHIEKGVIVLALALLLSTTAIVYLTSVNLVYTNDMNHQFIGSLDSVRLMTEQKKESIAMVFFVRLLSSLPANNETRAFREQNIRFGFTILEQMENVHLELYKRETDVESVLSQVLMHQSIDMVDQDDTGVPTAHKMTYFDALQFMIVAASSAMDGFSMGARRFPDEFVTIYNGPRTIHRVLSELTDQYSIEADRHIEEVTNWRQQYLWISLLMMMALTFAVFLPTIIKVERNKDEVLGYFLDLPQSVLRELLRSCQEALQFDQDEAAADEEIRGLQQDASSGANSAGDATKKTTSQNLVEKQFEKVSAMAANHLDKLNSAGKKLGELLKTNKGITRRYRKSNKRLIKFGAHCTMLLAIFVVYLFAEHQSGMEELELNRYSSSEIYIASHIHFHARSILTSMIESALAENATERAEWVDQAKRSVRLIETAEQALLFGGTLNMTDLEGWKDYQRPIQKMVGSAKRFDRRDRFLFEDSCVELKIEDQARCYSWPFPPGDGRDPVLFGHGLQSASTRMLGLLSNMLLLLENQPANPEMAIGRLLQSPDVAEFQSMISDILRLALDVNVQMYMDEINERETLFHGKRNWAFWIFIICVALTICINYIPLMIRIDRDVKRTRSMLLLLPNEVLNEVPSIRRMIRRNF